uniref:Piwi domain-containing protein n=1 Tax=Aegilops tauschii TaxID=37682 RepID=N1R2J7_AEGTA
MVPYCSYLAKPHASIQILSDGMTEGQFAQVLMYELDAIMKKRHHTRLFPEVHEKKEKSGNILPNTLNALTLSLLVSFLSKFISYFPCKKEHNVPPAYYAHLAAFRSRYYDVPSEVLDSASIINGGSRESVAAGAGAGGPPVTFRHLPRIRDNIKDVMFYC